MSWLDGPLGLDGKLEFSILAFSHNVNVRIVELAQLNVRIEKLTRIT